MTWTKKDIENLKGRVKMVDIQKKTVKKINLPKNIAKEKIHIEWALSKYLKNKFEKEYKFDQYRRFRFDWAIPEKKIAIEYEGMFAKKSRHTTVTGYTNDCRKYNLATSQEWKVLRYTALNYMDIENDLIKILNKL